MSPPATPQAYEVRCPRCGVSFPPETKRCLHCGGATAPPAVAEAAARQVRELEQARASRSGDVSGAGETGGERPTPFTLERPGPPGSEAETADEAETRAGRLSRGLGLLWILAVVGVSIYRACAGAPQP